MSNRVTIQRTVFENLHSNEKTYGYRAYDAYGQTYDNTFDEKQMELDNLEFLKLIAKETKSEDSFGNNVLSEMFDYIRENETGIYVDGDWYEWEEIKDILAE